MSWCKPADVADILAANHYLGPSRRGIAWRDQFGVIVLAAPTSRRLPQHWLELVRWCITSSEKNSGSRQWAAMIRALRNSNDGGERPGAQRPKAGIGPFDSGAVTTIVSYSDPSVGHTGALYRACNWLWAPTWLRLRPPPTGNGAWQPGKVQSVKDRWVFPVRPDAERERILRIDDGGVLKRWPWAVYREPGGVPFKEWARAKAVASAQLVLALP